MTVGHRRPGAGRGPQLRRRRRPTACCVRLTVDGRVGPEQSVDLPVGEDVPVVFNQQFSTPGDHLVEVADRRRPAGARQPPLAGRAGPRVAERPAGRRPFQVRAVPGRDRLPGPGAGPDARTRPGSPARSASRSSPSRSSRAASWRPTTWSSSATSPSSARPRSPPWTTSSSRAGAWSSSAATRSIAENYNRLLYADGKGLLPAAIGPSVGDAAKKEAAFGFNPLGYRHPIVAEFRGESDPVTAGLTRALTWQYPQADAPQGLERPGRAGLRERRSRGRSRRRGIAGTVIQVATSADAGWTTWPLHKSYPAGHAADRPPGGRGPARRAEHPGRPAATTRRFPRPAPRPPVTVVTPKGQPVADQAQGRRRRQPAPLRADRALGAVSGQDRPAAGARDRRSPPTPTRPRATRPSSTSAALGRAASRLELRLPDQLARIDQERRVGGPPRRAASPIALRRSCLLLLESFLAWKFGHHDSS